MSISIFVYLFEILMDFLDKIVSPAGSITVDSREENTRHTEYTSLGQITITVIIAQPLMLVNKTSLEKPL
jgi:hypothetical protein